MSCRCVTNDDRLHTIDSVHANDFSVGHYGKLAAIAVCRWAEASTLTLHRPRVPGAQHEQHTPPELHCLECSAECACIVTGHDEIDGSELYDFHHLQCK